MSAPSSSTASPDARPATVRVECGQASDPGRDPSKQVNEDSAGFATTRHGELFVVCDGMGGHSGGQQASELAIRTIFEMMGRPDGPQSPRDALRCAIEEAGRRVYKLGGPPQNLFRPGSTCVAILLRGDRAEAAHVGDSRAYAVRAGRIFRLTRDHSLVQELIDSGALSEEQAVGHPDANKITRALGMTPEVDVEVRLDPLEVLPGDVFVLATDGLTDLLSDQQIRTVVVEQLETSGPPACASTLVSLANDAGGHDNITVQVVRVAASEPLRATTLAQGPRGVEVGNASEAASAEQGATTVPPTSKSAPDTIPDDTSPTIIDVPAHAGRSSRPSGPGAHATEPDADDAGLAVDRAAPLPGSSRPPPSPIGPTEPGEPVVLAAKGARRGVATTAPGRPPPTVVDPTLAGAPVAPLGPLPIRRVGTDEGGDLADHESGNHPLLYVVVVMAVAIGALLAAVLWSTFGR